MGEISESKIAEHPRADDHNKAENGVQVGTDQSNRANHKSTEPRRVLHLITCTIRSTLVISLLRYKRI
jgi:hypothetical protein